MNDTPQGRGPFPVSLGCLFWLALAVVIIQMTVRDVLFQSQTDPVIVRTLADVKALEDNSLVEIHLPLDLDDLSTFTFKRGGTFGVVAFKGTGRRLFYSFPYHEDTDLREAVKPPLRGRAEGKDFGGTWDVGPTNHVKLGDVFEGEIPETALVVRPDERRRVGWLQWAATGVSVVALGCVLLTVVAWLFGIDLAADDEEDEETTEATADGDAATTGDTSE